MASPSVTYAFTNGTTADATQVNQNFTDLINGLSDGTKDLSISALTAAGNTTLNGNTTLGNASSDDLTVTASLASTIPIKTTATYDIGSSTKGLLGLYLGNSTFTTKLATGATASWTFTLPATAGVAGQGLVNSGSGTVAWKYLTADTSAKSADYTVTDSDQVRTVLVTTSSTDRTITLPTAADNSGRFITIKKVDSGTGSVTVDGEGSETIDGATTIVLRKQYEDVTLQCDGTGWHKCGPTAGLMPGSTAGTTISANFVGEMPGASQRSGTGGSAYTVQSTTTWSTSLTAVCSVTLNKGIYLVSGVSSFTQNASAQNCLAALLVGGTQVSMSTFRFTAFASGETFATLPAYPVIITADSTAVALAMQNSTGTVSSARNELCAIRIA